MGTTQSRNTLRPSDIFCSNHHSPHGTVGSIAIPDELRDQLDDIAWKQRLRLIRTTGGIERIKESVLQPVIIHKSSAQGSVNVQLIAV